MKKSIRFIVLLLSLAFLISGLAMVFCHAEPGDGVDVSGGEGVDVSGGEGVDVGGEGVDVGGGEGVDNGQSGVDNGQSGVDNSQSGGDSGHSGGDNSHSGGDTGSDNSSYSDNSGQDYDYDPIAYGDNSNYDYNITDSGDNSVGTVTQSTPQYDTSGMSAADAAPNEWSEITLDEKTVRTGSSDFSAIQEDTEIEDKSYPFLEYLFLLRYPFLILSVLGILFVIIDFILCTSSYRNAVRRAERSDRRGASAGAPDRTRRADDEYRTRFADEDTPRTRRTSSRADTDEVYVPRRVAKKSR